MKRLIMITIVLSLVAATANASVFGVRGGFSVGDPGQIHIGAHMDMGSALPPLRLVPNIEMGFGGGHTLTTLNGDLLYDVPNSQFYVGGELGLMLSSWDAPAGVDDSDSEIGLSAVGGLRSTMKNGQELMFECKLGLANSPDAKLTIGISVF